MSTLAAKYTKLKKLVGGNREKVHYEETFGMPQEEFHRITVPNASIRRILAETEFSIRLSAELDHRYDGDVEKALDFMQEAMDRDGVLTKDTCMKAEEMLLPLADEAKAYKLILAAHAHIDMNWMWGWQETVASAIATFTTMLKLMDEYPEFCFSQSQTSVYKIVEDYAPELKPQIQKRIAEGRWEITASAWVETDKNMPSTESILNHIRYTRKYLKEHWDIDPDSLEIDFSPDTFGHSANIPELDQFGGVKYYYHCRGLDGDYALYRWRAPSGKETLNYREQYWYNSGITPLPGIGLIDVAKRSGGFKTGLVVYGVGDHGGGPTRRDIERAIEMMDWPVFPQVKFGTFREFFKEAESVREKLPVVDHEMNYFAPGCYTTQSRLKMGNRHAEAALFDAQAYNALASYNLGTPYCEKQYESAWQNVLFTHFHDILTGSCVQESREHAMGLFAHAMAVAGSRASLSMQNIAAAIDTSSISCDAEETLGSQSEGAGAGYGLDGFTGIPAPERGRGKVRIYTVFNTASAKTDRCVELTVWDWVGDMRRISVTAATGEKLPFTLLDEDLQQYWDHKYFRLLVKVPVPAFGYTTLVVDEEEPEEYTIYLQPSHRTSTPNEDIVLENEYLKASFDYRNGELYSLFDKESGREMLKEGKTGGLRYIVTERKSSSAWNIGRYVKIGDPFETTFLRPVKGSVASGFVMEQKIASSTVKATVSLEEGARALSFRYEIDWHEVSRDNDPVPVLAYLLPVAGVEKFLYDVPGGAQYRGEMEQDVPALQYGAAISDGRAAFITADCKYGYRGCRDGLVSTLINASYSPDPYPERGIHKINLHVGAMKPCRQALEEYSFICNHPLKYQPVSVHEGSLPLSASLLSMDSVSAAVSGVTFEDGALCVKLYETCGIQDTVTLTVYGGAKKALLTDLNGHILGEAAVSGDQVSFTMEPCTVAMVRITK